jgi:HEAT repeat protein
MLQSERLTTVYRLLPRMPMAIPERSASMDKNIRSLIKALRDKNDVVSFEAAVALGDIGPKAEAAIPALIEALQSRIDWVCFAIIFALGRIGTASVNFLTHILDDGNDQIRFRAAEALGRIRPPPEAAVLPLIKAIQNGNDQVRYAAAFALGKFGAAAEAAIPSLYKLVRSKHVDTSAAAIFALGMIGIASIGPLGKTLRHDQARIRCAAASALGSISPPAEAAIPLLVKTLRDVDSQVRYAAAVALGKIGQAGIEALLDALKNKNAKVKILVSKVLISITIRSNTTWMRDLFTSFILNRKHSLSARLRAIETMQQIDPIAATALAEAAFASKDESELRRWDMEASHKTRQLKLFYLVGRLFREGKTSIRSVTKSLKRLEDRLFEDELPTTNVSFADNTEQLVNLFARILEKETVTIYVKRIGLGNQFSDDAWQAWEWTDGFLRRHLPVEWFGFSPFTALGESESES